MHKKITVFLIVAIIIFSITGCGKKDEEIIIEANQETETVSEKSFEKPTHDADYFVKLAQDNEEKRFERVNFNGQFIIYGKEYSRKLTFTNLNDIYPDKEHSADMLVDVGGKVSFSNMKIIREPIASIEFENNNTNRTMLGELTVKTMQYAFEPSTDISTIFGQQIIEFDDNLDFLDNVINVFGIPDNAEKTENYIDIRYYYDNAYVFINFMYDENVGSVMIYFP